MLNELQKLIDKTKARRAKAIKFRDNNWSKGYEVSGYEFEGRQKAFALCIKELTLLLNTEKASSGQNDSANSGNAM